MEEEKVINMLIHAYRDGQRDMQKRAMGAMLPSDRQARRKISELEIKDPPR